MSRVAFAWLMIILVSSAIISPVFAGPDEVCCGTGGGGGGDGGGKK